MAGILILGIGQGLRRDDGAGLAVVKRWQVMFPEHTGEDDIKVECLELPGLGLLNYIAGVKKVLIVDGVQSGASPGCLHWLTEKDLVDSDLGSENAHGWGVAESLALGRETMPDLMPGRIDILGIEVKDTSMGEGLSLEVASAMEVAAKEIEYWLSNQRGRG